MGVTADAGSLSSAGGGVTVFIASCSFWRVLGVRAPLRILSALVLEGATGATPWAGLIVPVVPGPICPAACTGAEGSGTGVGPGVGVV